MNENIQAYADQLFKENQQLKIDLNTSVQAGNACGRMAEMEMTRAAKFKAELDEARKMADCLCNPCSIGHQHHLADVMEKHVFRAGQNDGQSQLKADLAEAERLLVLAAETLSEAGRGFLAAKIDKFLERHDDPPKP